MESYSQTADFNVDRLGELGIDPEDLKDIQREIDTISLNDAVTNLPELRPSKHGFVFPLTVNILVVLMVIAVLVTVFLIFNREQNQIFQNGVSLQSVEGRILQELRSAAAENISSKDKEIQDVRSKLLALEQEHLRTIKGLEGPERERAEANYLRTMEEYQGQIRTLSQERQGIQEELRSRETRIFLQEEQPAAQAAPDTNDEAYQAARRELEELRRAMGNKVSLEDYVAAQKKAAESAAAYEARIAALETELISARQLPASPAGRNEEEYAAATAALQQEHAAAMTALRQEHATAITALRQDHTAETASLRREHTAATTAMTALRQEHTRAMTALQRDHAAELTARQERIRTLEGRIAGNERTIRELNSAIAGLKDSGTEPQSGEIAALSSRIEEMETANAALSRQRDELQAAYDGIAAQAGNQRGSASAYQSLLSAYQLYDASAGGMTELRNFLNGDATVKSFPRLLERIIRITEEDQAAGYREGVKNAINIIEVALRLNDNETRRRYLIAMKTR
ncbi:MAG: hypothetical protein LBD08_00845, partial [Treponema sp.]|nr:hypothetical protein [Treponema sp.]